MDGNPVSLTDVMGLEATADGNEKVAKGETLWGIAKRRGTTVEKIRELNELDPADDKKLPVGKVLQMPEATKSTTQKKNAVKAKQKAVMKQKKIAQSQTAATPVEQQSDEASASEIQGDDSDNDWSLVKFIEKIESLVPGLTIYGDGDRFLGANKGNSQGSADAKEIEELMGAITGSMTDKKNNKGPNGKKSIFANLDERIEDKFDELKEQYGPELTDEEKAELIVELVTSFSDVLEEVVRKQNKYHGNTSIGKISVFYTTDNIQMAPFVEDTLPRIIWMGSEEFNSNGFGDTVKIRIVNSNGKHAIFSK